MNQLLTSGGHSVARVPRPRGRPRASEVASIDQQLIEAATVEFTRHGYAAGSMRNIARLANVSRTTLSARFASKADLFCAIIRHHGDSLDVEAPFLPEAIPDLRAGIVNYCRRVLAGYLSAETRAHSRLFASTANLFPEIGQFVIERNENAVKRMAGFIQRCAEADGIPCTDPRLPATSIMMLLRGWISYALLLDAGYDQSHASLEQMVDTMLAGRSGW